MTTLDYEREGAAIYTRSFATIRAEADLSKVASDLEPVVVRMIHACGDVDIVHAIAASNDLAVSTRAALEAGRPIWCDSNMVAHGITRSRLPADNPVRCSLNDIGVIEAAREAGNTRSAVAVERWLEDLDGAVAVIGNAPTALFRLLELVLNGAPALPPSSASPWVSSERPNRSSRCPPLPMAFRISPCTAAGAAAR